MHMSLMSRLMGWLFQLPPAETHDVVVEKDLEVPMPDGVVILTDHYAPRALGSRPTLLMRSVYTDRIRAGWTGELWAERGLHVLMQSGRGAAGSGGTLDPFQQEYDDGLATLEWLKQQDWFNGELVVSGASYAGFTAWATACAVGPLLKAMSTQITSADFRSMIYPGDALALEVWLRWLTIIHTQERRLLQYLAAQFASPLKIASLHLPLSEADMVAFGKSYPFWREWLSHDQPGDASPPPTVSGRRWYLQPGGGLTAALPLVSEPDHYRYDPSNPTPSVGGAGRFALRGRGAQDNRSLEGRPDVLTYTSARLDHEVEIIGPVSTDLFVRSSEEHPVERFRVSRAIWGTGSRSLPQ
jgi:predicted acyl esterase